MKDVKWISVLALFASCASVWAQTNISIGASPKLLSASDKMAEAQKRLLEKYDLDKNGRIDVAERKEYVRERARLTQQYGTEEAMIMRTNSASARTIAFGRRAFSPEMDRKLLEKYDSNKNGRLDNEEMKKLQEDRSKVVADREKAFVSTFSEAKEKTPPANDSKDLDEMTPSKKTDENFNKTNEYR